MRKILCILCAVWGLTVLAQDRIDLTGIWDLAKGDTTRYEDYVALPALIPSTGGQDTTHTWYKRGIYIPDSWVKQRITLFLERPHAGTTVYVNGQLAGQRQSLAVPHVYDITPYITTGKRNYIAIDVTNGISGAMELRMQPRRLYIKSVKIAPKIRKKTVRLDIQLDGQYFSSMFADDYLEVAVRQEGKDDANTYIGHYDINDKWVTVDMPLGKEVAQWDEFHPNLYRLVITASDDIYEARFGMREVAIDEGQLYLNGLPIWLRGVINDGSFPGAETDTDEATWLKIFTDYGAYGINYIRFKGYCPPEATFSAADKTGMYLQLGVSSADERKQIEETYGNHPSLILMADNTSGDLEELSIPLITQEADTVVDRQQTQDYYKNEIERNLRSADDAGFLLDKIHHDAEWREFCYPAVPLAKLPKSVYAPTDTLKVPVEIYNAFYGTLTNTRNFFFISNESGQVLGGGQLSVGDIPVGKNTNIGTVRYALDGISCPAKLSLYVVVAGKLKNHWDFWVRRDDPE